MQVENGSNFSRSKPPVFLHLTRPIPYFWKNPKTVRNAEWRFPESERKRGKSHFWFNSGIFASCSVNNGRAVERFCDSAVGFLLLNQLTVDGQWRGFLIQLCDSLEPVLPGSKLFGYVSLLVMSRNQKWLSLLDVDKCCDYWCFMPRSPLLAFNCWL